MHTILVAACAVSLMFVYQIVNGNYQVQRASIV
jgi:hypothetical protein